MAQDETHAANSRSGQNPQQRVLDEVMRVGRAIELLLPSEGADSPAVKALLQELGRLHEKLNAVMQTAARYEARPVSDVAAAAPPSAVTMAEFDRFERRVESRLARTERDFAELKTLIGRLADALQASPSRTRPATTPAPAKRPTAPAPRADSATEAELRKRIGDLEQELRRHYDLEAGLLTSMRDIRTANQAKSDFLANMSHELRTPLNAIIGFAEIMESELVGPLGSAQYKSYSADIREAGQHLLEVINDILDLSKIESGRLELDEEDVDLRGTVEACLRMVHDQAKEAGLSPVLEAEDVPTIRANARMIRQIVMNLLTNALKFTEPGGSVTVTLHHDTNDKTVEIVVADTGIGIDPREIPRILRPFEQVESDQADRRRGTGLGLPLAKSLTELHGGRFRIQSHRGQGTTVTVRLPVER